jgi:hypothetical protein
MCISLTDKVYKVLRIRFKAKYYRQDLRLDVKDQDYG